MTTLTLEKAKTLKLGDHLIDLVNKNKDGRNARWKVIGKPKTWKRDSSRVLVSLNRGLYEYDKISERDLSQFAIEE